MGSELVQLCNVMEFEISFQLWLTCILQTYSSPKFSFSIVAALDLQVQDFNKPTVAIPFVIAKSHMANTRRSKLKPWKSKPIQVTSDPQFALVCYSSLVRERLDQPT